jgi:hypothetical protein
VERGIVALDTQKDPGPERISPLILINIVLVVKKPLAVLFNSRFNLSLLSGVFPCRKEGVVRCPFVQEWRQEKYFELSWNTYFMGDS